MNPLHRLIGKWQEQSQMLIGMGGDFRAKGHVIEQLSRDLESELVKANPTTKRQIVISIEAGVIFDIANIAEDTEVVVLDFDTEFGAPTQYRPSPWAETDEKILIYVWQTGGTILPYKEVSNG